MRKRLVGAVSLCLTAGLAWAEEAPQTRLPEPGSLPAAVGAAKDPTNKLVSPEQLAAPQSSPAPNATPQPDQAQGAAQPGPMASAPGQAPDGTQAQPNGQMGTKKSDLADEHAGPWNTFWANAEYIHWWTKPGSVTVPLLNVNDGPIILGNSDIDYEDRSGGRVTAGMWVDGQHIYGLEAGGFLLARPTIIASAGSDAGGNPTLARPITNALTNAPASLVVSLPGAFAGTFTQASESRLWGVEANVVRNVACKCHFDADLLFGFRFLDLDENLKLYQATTVLDSNATVQFPNLTGGMGSVVSLLDSFSTRNQLFAGQVGGRFCFKAGCWTVEGVGKVALGPMHEALTILGNSTLMTPAGASSTVNGGLLALPGANFGHTSTNWFTIAPEVGVQLGYQLTQNLRLQFGYNYLYINNVIRPGNQINTTVNPQLVPSLGGTGPGPNVGPLQPQTLFRQQEFWAHGLSAGIAFRY
jgi:hypothetical protein